MKSQCPIKRRSIRLLTAISELHKQGYQNLAGFFYMSPSGFHWRLELKYFHDLYFDTNHSIEQIHGESYEESYHSSGQAGNAYFGWDDAKGASARELAELIKRRFPRLLALSRGTNFEYAGWFNYMLGYAEKEVLPVFFRDYSSPIKGKIHTTLSDTTIIAPPHKQLNTAAGLKFIWAQEPDLEHDWHTAYRELIDRLHRTNIMYFPKFPSHTTCSISHGAYWEGAVYYLQTVMHYESEADYICDRINSKSRWREFAAIFDSRGQLHLFDAHMARVALKFENDDLSSKVKHECKKSLADIELMYQEKPYPFPNPYFGGNNPLQLARLDAPR